MRTTVKMTEVTGTLQFTCFKVNTVDENDLPLVDKYEDGLKNFKLESFCCKQAQKFNESDDGYCKLKMTTHPYPNILNIERGEPCLIIDFDYDSWESSHQEDLTIPCCPFCQTKATLTIINRKRIKRCYTEHVPATPATTTQKCSVKVVDDNDNIVEFDR